MFEFSKEQWYESDYEKFVEELKSLSDEKYRKFHQSLAGEGNTVLIGVKTPILRDIAKKISKGDVESFLRNCKCMYYEEVVIEGMVIGGLKLPFDMLVPIVDEYVPKISSWAINDLFCTSLKQVKKDKKLWFDHINIYLKSDNPWLIRCGLVLMLSYFLDPEYINEVLSRVDGIKSDYYYVKMGQAWLIATAFVKCRKETEYYLCNNHLNNWVLNKAIRKIRESYRVSSEDKEYVSKFMM